MAAAVMKASSASLHDTAVINYHNDVNGRRPINIGKLTTSTMTTSPTPAAYDDNKPRPTTPQPRNKSTLGQQFALLCLGWLFEDVATSSKMLCRCVHTLRRRQRR